MILQIIFCVEITVSFVAVIRTDRISFQEPEIIASVSWLFTFSTFQVDQFVVNICQVEIDVISEILVYHVIMEYTQVETCVPYFTGILSGSVQAENTLYREQKKHIFGRFFISSQFKS